MKYVNTEKLEESIHILNIPDRIKTDIFDFLEDYSGGFDDTELGEKYDASPRTIRTWLKELRNYEIIPYRAQMDLTDASKEEEDDIDNIDNIKTMAREALEQRFNTPKNTANISKPELLKLLNIHNYKTRVAEELQVPVSQITNLIKYYNIVDSKTLSKRLNKNLSEILKNYNPEPLDIKITSSGASIILELSDWHVGKVIKNEEGNEVYNVDIFEKRVDHLIAQIFKLLDRHMASHLNIEEFVILGIGDFANGEGIYPTQAYDQEEAPPEQVMVAIRAFIKIITSILSRDIPVKFYAVKGNHGANNKDSDPESNWDLMIYKILGFWKSITNQKNMEIGYGNRDYFNCTVRNWNFHLRHQAYYQDETSAGDSKFKGWKEMHNADVIVSGHYHHWSVNERKIMGASLCGRDDLAEKMAVGTGEPTQLIWVTTNKYSHTNLFPIRVNTKEKNKI